MDIRCSASQDIISLVIDEVAHQSLLRQCLESLRKGNLDEGISFLAKVRAQLTLEQMHLASLLDKIADGYTAYCQLHESLLQAERNFAKGDSKPQTRLVSPGKLLSASNGASNNGQNPEIQSGESSWHDQSSRDSDSHPSLLLSRPPAHTNETFPDLYITCFGHFEVYRESLPVELCPNRNGQAILRYLVAQSDHCATADKLMGILWPDDEQEVARHKVHVAISALRSSLNKGHDYNPSGGYILHKNRTYQINPAVSLKTDVGEFLSLYQAGRHAGGHERTNLYEKACHLYTGPFLVEDMYADWSFVRREQLSQAYLSMCHALSDYFLKAGQYEAAEKWASIVLEENRCDETAHRLLMLAYAAQGRRSEALHQYQCCERALHDELGVSPGSETIEVFQTILTSS